MQLNTLSPKTARVKSPRVGRGGKRGKTSGRGGKGQTARAGHKIRPEMRDMIKKLPKRRGHGKNRSRTVRTHRKEIVLVTLAQLDAVFTAGDTITPAVLARKGIVSPSRGRMPSVKLLATGSLSKALSISGVTASEAAKAAIEKAGGSLLIHAR